MTVVNSVLGKIDVGDLGFTLMHDHIILSLQGAPKDYAALYGLDYMEYIVEELKRVKAGGVDTIVEATTADLGRDAATLVEASRRSGVNIIAVGGWWLNPLPRLGNTPVDELARMFMSEVEEGVGGTDVKAGILKAASDFGGVRPADEAVLRGVARAHLQTGVPIMLHSYAPGQVGRQQIDILRQEGIDLTRVKVDHCNDTTDMRYLTWLLEQGCYLGMERYPDGCLSDQYWYESTLACTRKIKALIDAGYGDRLLPSHDWVIAWSAKSPRELPREARRATEEYGLLFVKTVVCDQLREMGVSEAMLTGLFVDNPRRFFAGER